MWWGHAMQCHAVSPHERGLARKALMLRSPHSLVASRPICPIPRPCSLLTDQVSTGEGRSASCAQFLFAKRCLNFINTQTCGLSEGRDAGTIRVVSTFRRLEWYTSYSLAGTLCPLGLASHCTGDTRRHETPRTPKTEDRLPCPPPQMKLQKCVGSEDAPNPHRVGGVS